MTGSLRGLPLLLLLALAAPGEERVTYATFGPMMHVNFGNGQRVTSYALEAAFWNYPEQSGQVGPSGAGVGWSFGWEWERGATRYYTEPQIGVVGAGASLGPVLQRDEGGTSFGWQGSLWVNALLGADVRYRRVGGESWVAPGAYFKLPLELDDGR